MPFFAEIKRRTLINVGAIATRLSRGPKAVKVGFPAGKVGGDIVARAIWTHYGTRGGASGGGWGGPIPPRPFLSNAMRANRGKYNAAMAAGAKGMLLGSTSLQGVLQKLGIMAQSDIQGEITSGAFPPNSPVTIARKGSSRPLVDSGQMRQSVTYKLEDSV